MNQARPVFMDVDNGPFPNINLYKIDGDIGFLTKSLEKPEREGCIFVIRRRPIMRSKIFIFSPTETFFLCNDTMRVDTGRKLIDSKVITNQHHTT
jgi:hypothetical protein